MSISISILPFLLINISISMHCAPLLSTTPFDRAEASKTYKNYSCRSYDSRSSGRSLRSRSRSPRGGSRERREREATHDAMVLEARARIHQMMGGSSSGVSSDTSQDLYAGQLFNFYQSCIKLKKFKKSLNELTLN